MNRSHIKKTSGTPANLRGAQFGKHWSRGTKTFHKILRGTRAKKVKKHCNRCIVMQEASDALSKTADSDTVSTYQVSSVQLVTHKKLEVFNKA